MQSALLSETSVHWNVAYWCCELRHLQSKMNVFLRLAQSEGLLNLRGRLTMCLANLNSMTSLRDHEQHTSQERRLLMYGFL